MIANPSFERPVTAPGTFTDYGGGAALDGWEVTGSSVAIVSSSYEQAGNRFPAAHGSQWLDLSGATAGNGGVRQSVATDAGAQYTLSWYVGNVTEGGFGSTSRVTLLIDGEEIRTVTNSQPGNTLAWQRFTESFTAPTATTVIEFRTADPTDDPSNGLDDVSLVPVGAPTLERNGERGYRERRGPGARSEGRRIRAARGGARDPDRVDCRRDRTGRSD